MVAVLRKVYGGCMVPARVGGTREASNDGRMRVHVIHGLNISHEELTYLLQKIYKLSKKSTTRMLLGEGLVGVNHRAIPTSTHKEDNQ